MYEQFWLRFFIKLPEHNCVFCPLCLTVYSHTVCCKKIDFRKRFHCFSLMFHADFPFCCQRFHHFPSFPDRCYINPTCFHSVPMFSPCCQDKTPPSVIQADQGRTTVRRRSNAGGQRRPGVPHVFADPKVSEATSKNPTAAMGKSGLGEHRCWITHLVEGLIQLLLAIL